MFTEHIHVSAAPDFAIKIGQVVHTHTIAICFNHKHSQFKEELFSHPSQMELVKKLQQRLVAQDLGSDAMIKWYYAEELSAEISKNGHVEVNFEYRLPSQLPRKLGSVIYKEFVKLMSLFVESRNS